MPGKTREYRQMEMPCPKPDVHCDQYSPYRTIDGTCNNLANPELGKAFIPQNRFLPAEYDDGIDSPRTRSKSGDMLPSPRLISENVFRQKDDNLNSRLTLLVMSWGQFAEHDVIFTPASTMDEHGHLIKCCTASGHLRKECFPIRIMENDTYFKKRCMEFIRSTPVLKDPCKPCSNI
ncbi:hypothetical protein KUTeg_015929 [Tegillarca granosa]|uniref:Peroxidase n=1 Tax=Tegillarca granosa TaxID=220873 RepID=A0ABQ9EKL4_TEGGR|nr:hypothetical protein KUTeg_015929 [Tegillarca granosa]